MPRGEPRRSTAPLAATTAAGPAPSRFASPESYTPKHLAERILTAKAALEGGRKQVTAVHRYEGTVTQVMGDGIMAYCHAGLGTLYLLAGERAARDE